MRTVVRVSHIKPNIVQPGSVKWQRPSRNLNISSLSSPHSDAFTESVCLEFMLLLSGPNLSLTLILFLTVTNNLENKSKKSMEDDATVSNNTDDYLIGITANISDSTFSAFHAASASESALLNTEHSADSSCF